MLNDQRGMTNGIGSLFSHAGQPEGSPGGTQALAPFPWETGAPSFWKAIAATIDLLRRSLNRKAAVDRLGLHHDLALFNPAPIT